MHLKLFSKLRRNKKASFLDFFLIPVLLFVCVVFLIVGYMILHKVNSTNIFSSDTDAQNAINKAETSLLNMDSMMLFIVFGLSLFTMISAYFSTNHPAFFIFGVIMLAIAIMITAIISNTYNTLDTQPTLNDTTSNFVKVRFLMDKLPLYLAFIAFTTSILMYIGYQRNG